MGKHHGRFECFNRRIPLAFSALFPVKITARPVLNLFRVLVRGECGEMKCQETTAPVNLLLDLFQMCCIGNVRRFRKFLTVSAIRDNHDGVGVIQRLRIFRPAIQMIFDLDFVSNIGIVEHDLEQFDRPGIIMNSVSHGPMAFGACDQNNLMSVTAFLLGKLCRQNRQRR